MNEVNNIKEELMTIFDDVGTMNELNDLKVEYLGKKGKITELNSLIKTLANEEKKEFGMKVNELKTIFNTKYEELKNKIETELINQKLESERIDISLPATKIEIGAPNILEHLIEEVEELLISMGYDVVDGPEVEEDRYNFEFLNIPKGHPARDAQDTFYINNKIVLRTQTSPMQVRVMESQKPPIRIISPGRVYRSDSVDATHSPLFTQVEGLVVDKGITFADLKGTLEIFVKRLYGKNSVIRFRPHHFPFTEPSAEVDLQCFNCHGSGCSICKGEGWMEILGCGMVHPQVLINCGIDPEIYSGFALGMGLERVVMNRYNISDLRLFYENDIRFLEQF